MTAAAFLLAAFLAGDWPQFRGPNSDGRYDGPPPPLEWNESKNIAWAVPVPGAGWSSPCVAAGKVFLTAAVPVKPGDLQGDQSLRALAFDAASGKPAWDVEIRVQKNNPYRIHGKNRHASSSPLWHDGALYVHFGYMGTAKLDAESGKLVWSNFELTFPPRHGNGGSPILHEGKLLFTCDGEDKPYVAALDAATGVLAWRTDRNIKATRNFSFSTPTIASIDGAPQALCVGSNLLASYDPKTGAELWRFTTPDGFSTIPQPALGKGLAVYAIGYESAELIAVRLAGNKGDVTRKQQAWSVKRGAPMTPSPLIDDDAVYIVSDNGIASCLDLETGEIRWQERLGGNFSASPLLIAGHVLYLSEKGAAYVLKAGRQPGKPVRSDLPGATLATPAVADGAIYLRTDAKLYKIAKDR